MLAARPVLRSLAIVLGATPLVAAAPLQSQKQVSKELAELYRAEQQDQNSWSEGDDEEFSRRQRERRDRVMEILAAGLLGELEDWDHASSLLQHGAFPDDFLLAHVLSVPPAVQDLPFARFMAAATLDRFLQNLGRPQIFSTQMANEDPSRPELLGPSDETMSEAVRTAYGLEPLPREKNAEKSGKRPKTPGARDLKKLWKLAEQEPEPGASDPPEWLTAAREVVAGDTLAKGKDFQLAARLLGRSEEPDDLLMAHVLAVAAVLQDRKVPDGLELAAQSLDRFLLSIRRAQVFGTVTDGERLRSPYSPLPHAVLAEGYGLELPAQD